MVDTVVTRTFPEMRLVQMFITLSASRYLDAHDSWNSLGDPRPDIREISDYFFPLERVAPRRTMEFRLPRIYYRNFDSNEICISTVSRRREYKNIKMPSDARARCRGVLIIPAIKNESDFCSRNVRAITAPRYYTPTLRPLGTGS